MCDSKKDFRLVVIESKPVALLNHGVRLQVFESFVDGGFESFVDYESFVDGPLHMQLKQWHIKINTIDFSFLRKT